MPRFDDRFARQNRFGPPSGFPLTSTYSRIVHHLSGPNIYAPTQTFHQRIVVGRWCPLRFPPFTFIAHPGFATRILAYMLDSLVRVSRRVNKGHFVSISIPRGCVARTAAESTACCPPSSQTICYPKQRFVPRPRTQHAKGYQPQMPFLRTKPMLTY